VFIGRKLSSPRRRRPKAGKTRGVLIKGVEITKKRPAGKIKKMRSLTTRKKGRKRRKRLKSGGGAPGGAMRKEKGYRKKGL